MVVEAESDIAYNNQTQTDWDEEEQKATFQSIMSKAELSGTTPFSETNTLNDSASAFLNMLKEIKPRDDKKANQINAIIEKWNSYGRQK